MNVLVTGGAGFIGSHLVDALVGDGHVVRVLDNFSTGRADNVHAEADLIAGDLADDRALRRSVKGAEIVYHQAARGAVQRSVEDPLATDAANTRGTLALLKACSDAGVRRVVCASSSSVYGGAQQLPTPETAPTVPRSPYAVSKLAGEHYCRVFADLYGLETVTLRYFNVFGPRQRVDSTYAAVIPLFVDALRRGEAPVVHGDGEQSRDFTFVADVVAANRCAATAPAATCSGSVYNIAAGEPHSLCDLLRVLSRILGVEPRPRHVAERPGDIRHSWADVSAARRELGFAGVVEFEEGLRLTADWFTRP